MCPRRSYVRTEGTQDHSARSHTRKYLSTELNEAYTQANKRARSPTPIAAWSATCLLNAFPIRSQEELGNGPLTTPGVCPSLRISGPARPEALPESEGRLWTSPPPLSSRRPLTTRGARSRRRRAATGQPGATRAITSRRFHYHTEPDLALGRRMVTSAIEPSPMKTQA